MFRSIVLRLGTLFLAVGILASACAPNSTPTPAASGLRVVAIESFLADIAQNVAGDRVKIDVLMPIGSDPHSFEATPQDVRKITESNVLITNGAGFEEFLDRLLQNAGGTHQIIEATKGQTSRALKPNEPHDEDNPIDPHMWFDPTRVVTYVANIREGLTQADPAGAEVYKKNADAYVVRLKALDAQIKTQVSAIPAENRKFVTDHDTFGYYADRYGFEIVGMIVPSFSSADSTTAQGLAQLSDAIKAANAKAIFVEQSTNPQVANQISKETGAKVITGLYTHSLSDAAGPAPNYLKMMEYDTQQIVEALK